MTLEQLDATLEEHGIPYGGIYRAPEMLEDAHFKAREAIISVAHPVFGELKMQNVAPKLSMTPGQVRTPGPELGQHNDEVYKDLLGMDETQLAELHQRGVI